MRDVTFQSRKKYSSVFTSMLVFTPEPALRTAIKTFTMFMLCFGIFWQPLYVASSIRVMSVLFFFSMTSNTASSTQGTCAQRHPC